MAQSDMNIANQGFPAFRADLNAALAALVSNSSGATAPSATFPHQFWVDTAASPSVLKQRNLNDDAWVTIGAINETTGVFTLVDPSYTGTLTGGTGVINIGSGQLYKDASGNVGIGTSSPDARIQSVVITNNIALRVQSNLTSGTTADLSQIVIAQAGGTGFHYLRCYSSGGGVQQFAFRGDGQMLATSTSIASISDARTKENVRDAEDGLATVLGLRPVRFDFKDGFSNNRKNQLGFIAQEVEQVFPDAVDVSGQESEDGDQYKTVAPGTLIPVLVKAMQEQQAIITALTARVEALEAK
jgi:hypothetical protein